jgi:Rieske Fe-S protein
VTSAEGTVRALSTICPHLGCGVDWNDETQTFDCPCHGSVFDRAGRRMSGPSPRDLDELDVVTTDDEIAVRYRRFRTATPHREPIG